ncbi:hypothetical protein D3C71_1303300 [compost metagenome]
MKRKNLLRLLSVIFILAFMSSCQSEYERQIEHARELIKKERDLLNQMGEMETISPNYKTLESIQKELSLRAHLSGNEELFNEQVKNYRTNYETRSTREQNLISKFP